VQVNAVVNRRVKETRDANEDPLFEEPFPETERRSKERLSVGAGCSHNVIHRSGISFDIKS
jgi:hypothetical protein